MSDQSTPRARRRPRSRGYTLIEMVTVMTLIATLLGLGSVVLQRLIRAERAGREALSESAAVGRLADSFRADAHAAEAARLGPPEGDTVAVLTFEHDGSGPVEYRLVDGKLRVTRPPGPGVESAPRVVEYRFARRGGPQLALESIPGGTLAVLTFSDEGGRASVRDLRVEALVGRDRRPGRRKGGAP